MFSFPVRCRSNDRYRIYIGQALLRRSTLNSWARSYYIRVNLDVSDKSLKVSRRPGPREDKGKWELVARGIRLPLAVLEVNSKRSQRTSLYTFQSQWVWILRQEPTLLAQQSRIRTMVARLLFLPFLAA
jgi:hypothetical protein